MAGVVTMPEKTLKKLNSYIKPQWKICFFAAILVGVLAHIYKITNWLPNWDSLVFRYDAQNMLGLGRWFLPVVTAFSSFYDLPFLNGIIAIIFHALSAVVICRIFGVEKKITAFLIGGVVVAFPTVTSVMMYNYVADGYSIAFFLSSLAAFFLTKDKPKYILAVILIALSSGIYQAYLTVTITIILLKLINEIIFENCEIKVILKKTLFILISGILGVILYSIILKVLLGVFSIELIDYQGVSSSFSLASLNLVSSLYLVKETFIKCFFDFSFGANVYIVLNAVAFLWAIVLYIGYIIKNKIYKNIGKLIAVGIFAVGLVFGAGALAFINPSIDYHNLMLMGYCIFYIALIILYEKGKQEKCEIIKNWAILLIAIGIVFNQIVIANVSYHKAQMAYEKSFGVLVRIADRIEEAEGTEDFDKILVVGSLKDSEDYSVNLTPHITGITDGYIIRADDETVNQSVLTSALNDYCGKDYDFLSGAEKQKLIETEEIKAMGIWPEKNSVKTIDDIVIVKLSEGEK